MDLLTYERARHALETGETSCEKLVSSFLGRIREGNDRINAFVYVEEERALARARELDAEIHTGTWRALTGMVVAIKDVICQKDTPVTCGSRILKGFESVYSATAVRRLEETGAIIIGRTNCDEFAMGSSNESSCYGPVRNPLAHDRVPGGSSGGSAAAVAADMCHVALGTDTGGSVRQPAAFCGVTGLKPTYGRVSRYGLVAFASSFDCMGTLSRTASDAARVLQVISGRDSSDATSLDPPDDSPVWRSGSIPSMSDLKIGLPMEYFGDGLAAGVRNAVNQTVETLKDLGVAFSDVSLPHTEYGIAAYYVLTTAEASSNLARYDGVRYGARCARSKIVDSVGAPLRDMYVSTRTEGFGDEVKRRIMLGTWVLSTGYYDAYYTRAQRVRTLIRRDFKSVFEHVDALLVPTAPTVAFRLGEKQEDPLEMYLNDVYTVTANLAGIPGVSIPSRVPAEFGLPAGIQLLGPDFSEMELLSLAAALE